MDLLEALKRALKYTQEGNDDYAIITKLGLVRIIEELEKLEAIRQIIQEGIDKCDLGSHASAYIIDIKEVLKNE